MNSTILFENFSFSQASVVGLDQERLALDAGVDRTVFSKIERAVANPSLEILLRLANQLDVEVGQLLLPPTS